jgi:hypothetical protein
MQMMKRCIEGSHYVTFEIITGNVIWSLKRKMTVFSFSTILELPHVNEIDFAST